jgi:hypothetical protein
MSILFLGMMLGLFWLLVMRVVWWVLGGWGVCWLGLAWVGVGWVGVVGSAGDVACLLACVLACRDRRWKRWMVEGE